jgi:ferredoxin-type protein NapH
MKMPAALKRHPWRYLAFAASFLLFVHPAALLIRAAFWAQGSSADANLHKICFRMPFDWIVTGRLATFDGRMFLVLFLGIVLAAAFLFGPLFCGLLGPVGSSTELLSRAMPRKLKLDLSRKINPSALRYGFLASFILVSSLAAFAPALGLASICCRYCAASQLQNLVGGIFYPSTLDYWHSGAIMAIGAWLFFGGILWKGGRGWCLYACPLGAVSNLLHSAGARLGFTRKIRHDPDRCVECHKCEDVCPAWAIQRSSKDVRINRHTCNACLECVKACRVGCYSYGRG